MNRNEFAINCKYWIGYKPCKIQKSTKQRNCINCKFYEVYSGHALIIEAGGLGSVLRSSVVAQVLKKQNIQIKWLTNERGARLLENVPLIDRIFNIENWKSLEILGSQKFDLLINFESSPVALALARKFNAHIKRGFVADPYGKLSMTHPDAREFLQLQTDDIFRKQENCKSMQQILLETVGLKWRKQHYRLETKEEDNKWAKELLSGNNVKQCDLILGFNIGSSIRQKRKRWPLENFIALATILSEKCADWKIVVLAGPDEPDIYEQFFSFYQQSSLKNLIFPGYSNSISQFISLVNNLSLVVSCDTFGLHVAIALNKKVISLNGPQPSQELELYGLGEKIEKQIDCAPCFLAQHGCLASCMQIEANIVAKTVLGLL